MSNSAAKKARRRSNIFENDYDELIYSSTDTSPIKVKHIPKEKEKKIKETRYIQKQDKTQSADLFTPISNVPVHCTCNKCDSPTEGTLLAVMYCSISGLNTPFVSYKCSSCNHEGRRTVSSKALPTVQFERLYF